MINEEIYNALCEQIPNLNEFYTKEEVFKIMADADTNEEYVASDFMEEICEDTMHRCDVCGKLMYTGYYLNSVYACDDACRNEYYKKCCSCTDDADAERLYLEDYADGEGESYYTEWE